MADKVIIPSIEDLPPVRANTNRQKGPGRGAKSRRSDTRRVKHNVGGAQNIEKTEKSNLSINNLTITYKPSFGSYAGSVSIGFRGSFWFVKEVVTRLKSIAQRPLALLLTDSNIATYEKVVLYLLHFRICCAQDDGLVAVPNLSLRGTLSELEKRTAVGFCRSIPKVLAYLLNTFGNFMYDDVVIVPIVPTHASPRHLLYAADYAFICDTVKKRGAVPEDLRPAVEALHSMLPNFTVDNNNVFDQVSRQFWVSLVNTDWEVFRGINAATRAQNLNIDDYDVSAATGQPAQIFRFNDIAEPLATQQFYSTRLLNETEIIRALAVRPTDDKALPPGTYARFTSTFESALIRGFDIPSCAIEALLQTLAIRDSPTS